MARGGRMIGFGTVSLSMYNFKEYLLLFNACGEFAVNDGTYATR